MSIHDESIKKIYAELKTIPDGARLLLEGGCFTVKVDFIDIGEDEVFQSESEDTRLILEIEEDCDPLPFELWRSFDQEEKLFRVVLQPPAHEALRIGKIKGLKEAMVAYCSPTPTQVASLQRVLELREHIRGRAVDVSILIFFGDLNIPEQLRNRPDLFWPVAYSRLLRPFEESGCTILRFSEAECRNIGKRRAFRTITYLEKNSALAFKEEVYKNNGFALLGSRSTGAYFLTSDRILQELPDLPFAVAVTKAGRSRPTCGLILAGKYKKAADLGFSHMISCYDRADDLIIHRKNIDGMFIAGYLISGIKLRVTQWTCYTWRNECTRDEFYATSLDEIRCPGTGQSLQELLNETNKRISSTGADVLETCTTDFCVPAAAYSALQTD